jgi:hypothetical protein
MLATVSYAAPLTSQGGASRMDTNDLGREPVAGVADFPHSPWLPGHQRDRKSDAA